MQNEIILKFLHNFITNKYQHKIRYPSLNKFTENLESDDDKLIKNSFNYITTIAGNP